MTDGQGFFVIIGGLMLIHFIYDVHETNKFQKKWDEEKQIEDAKRHILEEIKRKEDAKKKVLEEIKRKEDTLRLNQEIAEKERKAKEYEDWRIANPNLGYLYVLSNKIVIGHIKIGFTTRETIQERIKEINRGAGVIGKWQLAEKWHVDDARHCEKLVHKRFKEIRTQKDREFFEIDLIEARLLIHEMMDKRGYYLKGKYWKDGECKTNKQIEWTKVTKFEFLNDDFIAYVDYNSIIKEGHKIKMRSMYSYNIIQKDANYRWFSIVMNNEYDSVKRTYRELNKVWSTENMGEGDIVYSANEMKDALEIKQGTIYEIFFNIACGKK